MAIKPVKWYTSSFENAPVVDSANGDLTKLLDAVLVNGFNVKSVSSITQTGGTATLTFPGTHGFFINQVVEIAGCNEAAFNGQFTVTSKATNTIQFAVDPASAASATGAAITVKTPALGWSIPFTDGANKRCYQSTNALSNKNILRVDDGLDPNYSAAYAKFAKVMMIENNGMTDINTFTGATAPYRSDIPAAAYQSTGTGVNVVNGWYKWYYSVQENNNWNESKGTAAGAKNWWIIGDDRGFYISIEGQAGTGRTTHCFTDFTSYRAGDAYNTLLTARDWYNTAGTNGGYGGGWKQDFSTNFPLSLDFTGKSLLKDYQQVGANVRAGFMSLNTNNAQTISGYQPGIPWPNGPDYGLILHPVYLRQENNHVRGKIPGMMWVHNDQPLQQLDFITGVSGYPGRTFVNMTTSIYKGDGGTYFNVARMVFDITGPWW